MFTVTLERRFKRISRREGTRQYIRDSSLAENLDDELHYSTPCSSLRPVSRSTILLRESCFRLSLHPVPTPAFSVNERYDMVASQPSPSQAVRRT